MKPEFQRNGKFDISEAFRLDHDELRAILASATAEPGPVGKAAKRVARVCLTHFEEEEKALFPVFGVLRDLASGDVRPEMAEVLPLISDISAGQLGKQHQALEAAIEALLQSASADESGKLADFANKLQVHERIEAELLYPAAVLVGKYLRENLGHRSSQPSAESGETWFLGAQQSESAAQIEAGAGTLDAFLDELVGDSHYTLSATAH